MLITCPDCDTAYDIDRRSLGAAGRPVRCARCGQSWFAAPPDHALEPAGGMTAAAMAAAASLDDRYGERTRRPDTADTRAPGTLTRWNDSPPDRPDEADPAADADAGWAQSPQQIAALDFEPAPPLVPLAGRPAEAETPDQHSAAQTIDAIAGSASAANDGAGRRPAAAKARGTGWRPGPGLLLAALATVLVGLVAGRTQMVRVAPQTAGLYAAIGLPVNLRGLRFEDVVTSGEVEAVAAAQPGVPVLVTQGRIINITAHSVDVPRLRFAVRNAAGVEVYAWTAQPEQPVLAAGESLPFRSRLASPPADADTVAVRFFNKHDIGGS